jgi:hypothetical protein
MAINTTGRVGSDADCISSLPMSMKKKCLLRSLLLHCNGRHKICVDHSVSYEDSIVICLSFPYSVGDELNFESIPVPGSNHVLAVHVV